MSELCRICMFPKFDLINLVKDGTDTLERSGEKFEDCFGIKVKELPYCQRICKECDKHLIDFYYFKQQALRTHNYLIDKACDLQAKCVDIKEEIDINDLQIRDNTPDEFCNIEYLDEDAAHVAPLEFVKKESEDEIIAIKQEKDEIESTDDTPSEVLDSYEQIESLMYEDANESISEDRIESEGVADNTKDNEGEEDKKPKENTISSTKRTIFTIGKKAGIISRLEKGETNSDLAKEFKISPSTVSTIWKNREKIQKAFKSKSLKAKRVRTSQYPDIEEALLKWFKNQKSDNIPVNRPLLRAKAKEIGKLLGKSDFNASESWIYRFRIRNNIPAGKVSGEVASVLEGVCND